MIAEYMALGVTFNQERRNGRGFFYHAEHIDERYKIVLVVTDDSIDAQLTQNIISIHRTQNQCELAELYTADAFCKSNE